VIETPQGISNRIIPAALALKTSMPSYPVIAAILPICCANVALYATETTSRCSLNILINKLGSKNFRGAPHATSSHLFVSNGVLTHCCPNPGCLKTWKIEIARLNVSVNKYWYKQFVSARPNLCPLFSQRFHGLCASEAQCTLNCLWSSDCKITPTRTTMIRDMSRRIAHTYAEFWEYDFASEACRTTAYD